MALNGIPEENHTLIQAHTFDFLETARRRGQTFDLAVVDPPSYSTTRVGSQAFVMITDPFPVGKSGREAILKLDEC